MGLETKIWKFEKTGKNVKKKFFFETEIFGNRVLKRKFEAWMNFLKIEKKIEFEFEFVRIWVFKKPEN